MTRKSTFSSNNTGVGKNERTKTATTLHSHHNGGSFHKETAKHTLRCLLGCNIGEGYRGSNRFYAWYGYDVNFDFSSRTSICNGLRIYYDSHAQNNVIKTSSKGNGNWRYSKYCSNGNSRSLISIINTRVYACSIDRYIILDRTGDNTTCRFCSIISSHVLGYETWTTTARN